MTRVLDRMALASDIRCQHDRCFHALVASRGAGAFAYSGAGVRAVLLPDPAQDGEIYLTTAQAAAAMGRKPPAIRRWVRIGYLAEAAPGLYRFSDVTAAEKRARDAAIRTSGTDIRARPNFASLAA